MTIQDVDSEFQKRVLKDSRLMEIRSKVKRGTATFADTAEYNDRASTILGDLLSGQMPSTPDGERANLCKYMLRHLYDDTNEMCTAVQQTLDKAQGLHLAPQKAPFPTERVQAIAGSLEDKTVPMETTQRRARSSATVGRSFHDDRMKAEADFRSRAGLKCYITRTAVGGCCPWCSAVAGKYRMGEEPDGIFQRHDNCDCTVIYDSQVLRGALDENGRRTKTWEEVDPEKVRGREPTVFTDETRPEGAAEAVRLTAEQARAAEARHPVISFTQKEAERLQRVLTNGVEGGKIKVNDRFYKEGADPMFAAFGRAEDSNPKELAELQARLAAIGVGFVVHDEEDGALAYQNTQAGKPGVISVTANASFSAWLHEAKHAFDDYEAGWNACIAVWDVEEHIRREINAYQEEIDYAVSLGRQDIAKQLEQLRDDEIAEIRRRDEEYARLYEIYGEGGT